MLWLDYCFCEDEGADMLVKYYPNKSNGSHVLKTLMLCNANLTCCGLKQVKSYRGVACEYKNCLATLQSHFSRICNGQIS